MPITYRTQVYHWKRKKTLQQISSNLETINSEKSHALWEQRNRMIDRDKRRWNEIPINKVEEKKISSDNSSFILGWRIQIQKLRQNWQIQFQEEKHLWSEFSINSFYCNSIKDMRLISNNGEKFGNMMLEKNSTSSI
jgi:hypothetical protein